MDMTPEALVAVCKERSLYRTPSLNETLYCNFKGFTNIASLEAYTSLKALYLEGNAIDSLTGLPPLESLKCLFVQQNMLYSLEGVDVLPNLDTLNVSNNNLTHLDVIGRCSKLATLICTQNKLATLQSVAELEACKGLTTLDLQQNRLDDVEVMRIFQSLPDLRCLYLTGNPVVSKIKNYRKTMIATIPTLNYLDDRPVFPVERRCAEAWLRGGLDKERAERVRCKQEEMEADKRNFEAMQAVRREGFRKRREALGLPPGDTDPYFDDMSDTEWEPEEEPEELVAARQKLEGLDGKDEVGQLPELAEAKLQWEASRADPTDDVDTERDNLPPATPAAADKKLDAGPSVHIHAAAGHIQPADSTSNPEVLAAQAAQQAALFPQTGHSVQHVIIEEVTDETDDFELPSRQPQQGKLGDLD